MWAPISGAVGAVDSAEQPRVECPFIRSGLWGYARDRAAVSRKPIPSWEWSRAKPGMADWNVSSLPARVQALMTAANGCLGPGWRALSCPEHCGSACGSAEPAQRGGQANAGSGPRPGSPWGRSDRHRLSVDKKGPPEVAARGPAVAALFVEGGLEAPRVVERVRTSGNHSGGRPPGFCLPPVRESDGLPGFCRGVRESPLWRWVVEIGGRVVGRTYHGPHCPGVEADLTVCRLLWPTNLHPGNAPVNWRLRIEPRGKIHQRYGCAVTSGIARGIQQVCGLIPTAIIRQADVLRWPEQAILAPSRPNGRGRQQEGCESESRCAIGGSNRRVRGEDALSGNILMRKCFALAPYPSPSAPGDRDAGPGSPSRPKAQPNRQAFTGSCPAGPTQRI